MSYLNEYHVKLLEDVILFPGYQDIFETACVINKGIQNISLHLDT